MGQKVKVDTTAIRACSKCKVTNVRLERHHMGFDSYIGNYHYKIAKDYDKFLDCCDLCDEHHLEIHWVYSAYVNAWWRVNKLKFGQALRDSALIFRSQLISICQQWLNGQIQAMPMPEDFRQKWSRESSGK